MAESCNPHGSFIEKVNEINFRADMKKHLSENEFDLYKNYEQIPPKIKRREFNEMMEDSEESSFNDDEIPDSEQELFSSSWDEDEVGDYIPPVTNKKKTLLIHIMATEMKLGNATTCDEIDKKHRENAIIEFKNYIMKKRAIKAYKRLQKVQDMNLKNYALEAQFLRKMELAHKKLNRDYYYEPCEPRAYKRLLKKRRKAVKRKYQLYRLDEGYRKELVQRTLACVLNVLVCTDTSADKALHLLKTAERLEKKVQKRSPVLQNKTYPGPPPYPCPSERRQKSICRRQSVRSRQSICPQQPKSVTPSNDDLSSMYDDRVPESEIELFTSEFEEDEEPYPTRKSRRIDKYNRLLNTCQPLPQDNEEEKKQKLLKRTYIEEEFKKFLDRRKHYKALNRFSAIARMDLEPEAEANQLVNLEIADKKLDKPYYYEENEPEKYQKLLIKRRKAIKEKYAEYPENFTYRNYLRDHAYEQYMLIQPVPLFEKINSPFDGDNNSDESSLNDTEIPSSDAEFMSEGELCLPVTFQKPFTRRKAALFERLQNFDVDYNDTECVASQKMEARLDALENFAEEKIARREKKAAARIDMANKMEANEPHFRANKLQMLELIDKKLHKPYLYGAGEPSAYTELLRKRRRAIERKYLRYIVDEDFRKNMESRIIARANQRRERRNTCDNSQLMQYSSRNTCSPNTTGNSFGAPEWC